MFIRCIFPAFHKSQEFDAYLHTKRFEQSVEKKPKVSCNMEIPYLVGKANVVVDALHKRPITCGAKLAVMKIRYDDQRANVVSQ